MKNLHISCNTVNCKIVRHFGNERVAMAASLVLVSLTLSRVLKHGGQVGHLVRGVNRGMQIRRSLVFLGPIRRSDLIFVQIRIRVTLKSFRGI